MFGFFSIRIAIDSVFGTLLVMLSAVAWQLHRPAPAAARALMVTSFLLAALAFYIRGVSAVFSAEPARAFLSPTLFESGLYLTVYAAILVGSFGFLLLHKGHADDATGAVVSTLDAVTGAYNRSTFPEIAERELSRARRAGHPLSILLVDIDHFAEAARTHGARFAEEVLKRFAEIVREALRKEDMIVRFGTGQFLLLLPDVPGPGAVVVAGRIRREIELENFEFEGERVPITVSAGVAARLDEGPESIDGLLARATDALALAQKRGRNRVVALSLGRSIAALGAAGSLRSPRRWRSHAPPPPRSTMRAAASTTSMPCGGRSIPATHTSIPRTRRGSAHAIDGARRPHARRHAPTSSSRSRERSRTSATTA